MISDDRTTLGPDTDQQEEVDLQEVSRIIVQHGATRAALVAILGDIQTRYRYLPEAALRKVSETIGMAMVDVYAAATFYHSFSLTPKGKHIISCCLGTACHVRGGHLIAEELGRQLQIGPGETTADMQFSLQTVNCLGACALGPVVVADGRYFSKVTKSQISRILDETLTGVDKVDPADDPRVFPIETSCPSCGCSLMDEGTLIDGRASIRLAFALPESRGSVALSCLYGTNGLKMEPQVPANAVVDMSCPHCSAALNGSWKCSVCEAPMVTMDIRGGGQLHICSRHGCRNRLLDLSETTVR